MNILWLLCCWNRKHALCSFAAHDLIEYAPNNNQKSLQVNKTRHIYIEKMQTSYRKKVHAHVHHSAMQTQYVW